MLELGGARGFSNVMHASRVWKRVLSQGESIQLIEMCMLKPQAPHIRLRELGHFTRSTTGDSLSYEQPEAPGHLVSGLAETVTEPRAHPDFGWILKVLTNVIDVNRRPRRCANAAQQCNKWLR